MRTYHSVFIAAILPAMLQAQQYPHTESFLLSPPGIVTKLEQFEALNAHGNVSIRSFAVDRKGFLWCRTDKGLARFDGYELKVYHQDPADTGWVFKVQLDAIAVDGDGFIWGGTPNGGLQKLDPASGQSRWYRGRQDDSTSIGTGATRLLVTSDGQLWAGARYGLAKYNPESDCFVRYNLPPDCPPVREGVEPAGYVITSLCELGRSIWVGLIGGGLAEFNRDTGVWKRYTQRTSTGYGPGDNIVRAVCTDRAGRLWIGTRNFGLDCYNPLDGSWRHFTVSKTGISELKNTDTLTPSLPVWAVVEDNVGGLWISVISGGVFRFDPASGTFLRYRHDVSDVHSIPSDFLIWLGATPVGQERDSMSASSQTSTSIIWIPPHIWGIGPTGIQGTHRVIVRKNPCTSVVIPQRSRARLPDIGALLPQSSQEIVATEFNGRLGFFNLQTRTVRWHPNLLDGIERLSQLRDKTLLVSTRVFRAWEFDLQHDAFVPFVPDLRITSFLEERDSLLWIGCRHVTGMSYLAILDRRTGRYTVYPRQDADSVSHLDGSVLRMCKDGRGALWYGTEGGGLIRFDLKQKTYRRYAAKEGSAGALTGNSVSALIPDSNGRLWVGTNAGLALMDCDRETFEHIQSGLQEGSEPWIRDMVDDGEGHFWIAAHEGAICFTKATRTFRWLSTPPQFPTSRFRCVTFEPHVRTVTFGGAGGFFRFSIDDPPPPSTPPPIVLTSFNVFEKPYPLNGEIWSLTSITLPHSASFFSLTFAALDYINPAKNQYAYRLEGLDPNWIQAGTRRYVSYSNLDPGTYVFRVRGANSEGIWNETGTAIEIIVLPPWYRTTWAYGMYFMAIVGFLYLLRTFDQRRAALKHSLEMKSFEAEKMREVDQMKSAFFANISHEFRTPLTLLLGPLEQLAEHFKTDERLQSTFSMMRRNGHRLLQLINQLLDLSKMDAGKMTIQVRPLELVSLSRSLVMSFLSLAESKRIDLIFDPEEAEILAYADRDKFEKILTNLLSNAFKFTEEGGEVKVALRILADKNRTQSRIGARGRRIELVVSDTGIGIDAQHIGQVFDRFYQVSSSQTQQHGGTGIGLALTKELVEILRGEIAVESIPGKGSTFVVRLPLSKEEWRSEEIVTEATMANVGSMDAANIHLTESPYSHIHDGVSRPGKPVVLIVEDNADVRTYMRGFLEQHFTIEEAENGKIGLERTHEKGIDLVISDVMMPVMNGVELCKELKGDDRTSHIPVILLTARATLEGKLEGLDIGADDYVVKPFEARELISRASNLIDMRRKLWEKYHQQVTLGPTNIPVTSTDERFLKRLVDIIERHVAETDYDTEALAHDMCMSRMQLNRKIHALTGDSTHELVRRFRLQRAAQLLRKHAGNVAEVAYESGFNSLSHFARAFREEFGVLPSEYKERCVEQSGTAKGADTAKAAPGS